MISKTAKRVVRRCLSSLGLTIRHVGRGVAGVDLLHDARILLENPGEPLLFDVGANIGQTTRAMLDEFRRPQVRAFEPSPATFDILQRAYSGRPGIILEPVALGSEAGILPFHVTSDYSVNDSLLTPTWNPAGTIVNVRVDTVDDYCRSHGIDSIPLLKIDTQGYDLEVLQGARGMLHTRSIRLFSCEAIFSNMYEQQATLRQVLAFADDVGYRLVGFYEQTYVRDRLSYVDALFAAP